MLIQTNLTRNYVADWTVIDAMRELVQNAIDSDPDGFRIDYALNEGDPNIVTIYTNTTLPLSSLYMGESTKRNDSTKLGVPGEGLKLALLILLREDRMPYIISDHIIEPKFINIPTVETTLNVLTFEITKNLASYTIIRFYATEQEWEALSEICLPKDTPYGLVKTTYDGMLYLGGLKIPGLGFTHSYNLAPGSIKLERDRRVADLKEVKKVIANIWLETKNWNAIVNGLLLGESDFEGLADLEELPKELISAIVARAEEFAAPPMSYYMSSCDYQGTYVPNAFYNIYTRPGSAIAPIPKKQPQTILEEWFKTNRSYFRKQGLPRMKQLIEQSKKMVQKLGAYK